MDLQQHIGMQRSRRWRTEEKEEEGYRVFSFSWFGNSAGNFGPRFDPAEGGEGGGGRVYRVSLFLRLGVLG